MAPIAWYRSLYWRIALGFVALLAALLAVQGAVFLWITGRASEILPGRSPAEYAQTIASDLAIVMGDQPTMDLDAYLNGKYVTKYRAFVVVTRDGRLIQSKAVGAPFDLSRAALGRLFGETGGPPRMPPPARSGGGGAGANPDGTNRVFLPDRARGGSRGGGRGRGTGPPAVFTPVLVNAEAVAMVAVPSEPPPLSVVMRDLGTPLALVAAGLLIAGALVGALVIFRPTHRRLSSLQEAARAIGAGQSGTRAKVAGGDEVTLLASAFNEMAAGLEQRTQALMAADQSRRQLLADVSHELMTPLAAIRGYTETMAMPDLDLDADTRRRYLGIVADETERMEHIIGDLLDLARLEGGGGAWKQEPVSVAALFERVLHRHDPALRAKRLVLERRIEPGADRVAGDPNRLEQAIQNLAANAVRHTPEGGTICLAAAPVDEGIRLSVEDTGPGIPDEHLSHVFDRFYKVDLSRTGTPLPSGSGLGLSIVQAIVRRHGGTIEARNAPGGGARFDIVLPRAS